MGNARHTTNHGSTIEYGLWLVFRSDGTVRLTRNNPNVDRYERAMALSVTLPKSIFSTPSLRGTIVIADPPAERAVIDVQAASAVLREAIGVDIDLVVRQPE